MSAANKKDVAAELENELREIVVRLAGCADRLRFILNGYAVDLALQQLTMAKTLADGLMTVATQEVEKGSR